MILETEGATFVAEWTAEEIKPDVPELAAGDINGDGVVDIADIVAVINKASGAELDATEYPGEPDINADGVVDIADIVAVINIASAPLRKRQKSHNPRQGASAPCFFAVFLARKECEGQRSVFLHKNFFIFLEQFDKTAKSPLTNEKNSDKMYHRSIIR